VKKVENLNMKYKCLLFIYIILVSITITASPVYKLDRIYVLNSSDYQFTAFKKDIRLSKRFRGNYVKRFKFKPLRFSEYYLKKGETLHTIALRMGISVDSIATASGLVFFYGVKTGQRLVIPNFDGIVYRTKQGCSLWYLSRKYGVSVADIKRYNNYRRTYLAKGDWLFIPGAHMSGLEQALFYGTAFSSPVDLVRISSKFGVRIDPKSGRYMFHGGVDMAAPRGTGVKAAHHGIVEFAGWAGGYGRLVVIRHAFGYRTFYGHLSSIKVSKGKYVKLGSRIGLVGSSGYSTGPHLHFEIRHYKRKINPHRFSHLRHQQTHQIIK